MKNRKTGRRRRNASQTSPRTLLVCGLLFAFVVFEFWVMHHHAPSHDGSPTRHHYYPLSKVPVGLPIGVDDKQESPALPREPSLPGSMREPSVPAHDRNHAVDQPRSREEPSESKDSSDIAVLGLPPRPPPLSEGSGSDDEGYGDMRVAVLVPYSGPGLPLWFDAFTDLAAANRDLVDWIIFCEEDLAQVKTPDNVRMISTSPAKLAWMLAGVVYPANADDLPDVFVSDFQRALSQTHLKETQKTSRNARTIAAKFIQKLLSKNAYYMVEFKPALGWIFREYLKEYSHWAFGDLDVFFGDLTKGWLESSEMRDYDVITYSFGDQQRAYLRGQLTVHKNTPEVNKIWRACTHLSNYMKRIETTVATKQYILESAEGCYSKAVMYSKNIKAKYAVKVFTDMPGGKKDDQEEVVITGDAMVKRCPYQEHRRGDEVEPDYGGRMQVGKGPLSPVDTQHTYLCEYWIRPMFQTCLALEGKETRNIFLVEGQFYEQDFDNLWMDKVESGCSMGAFHHFQGFKGSYRAWNTRPPMPPVHKGMVAGNGGLVPLPNGDWHALAADPDTPPPEDRDRFTHRYCLHWSVQNSDAPGAKFSCDKNVTPRDGLKTLHDSRPETARRGALSGGAAVTLGGVGGFNDLSRLLHSCREWEGPKILVLMLHEQEVEDVKIIIEENVRWLDNAHIVHFSTGDSSTQEIKVDVDVPTKALLNAVGDLCQTRHLLALPIGFRIARGAEKAVVEALETPTEVARALVVPQWCVDPADSRLGGELSSLDLGELRRQAADGTARLCLQEGENSAAVHFGAEMIEAAVDRMDGEGVPPALRGADTRHSGEGRWSKKTGTALLQSDAVSPAIVVDLWSAPALFLRHIEETSRSGCYDGAYTRGLWAAGYSFEILAGAAVLREGVPPTLQGCRRGTTTHMEAYSRFLKDIRRVYSSEVYSSDLAEPPDRFKLGIRDKARRGRRSDAQHPFGHFGDSARGETQSRDQRASSRLSDVKTAR
ncbi:unnamed protein product [Pylaiella littoralis]